MKSELHKEDLGLPVSKILAVLLTWHYQLNPENKK